MGTKKLQVVTHIVPKDCEALATKDFYYREFDCHCDNASCNETKVDGSLLELIQLLRNKVSRPLIITSGFRCEKHQQDLRNSGMETAKGVSSHELGKAVDLRCTTLSTEDLAKAAEEVGFTNIGVARNFIHLDVREGVRKWTYGS